MCSWCSSQAKFPVKSSIQLASAYPGAMSPALFALGERLGLGSLERILAGVELNFQRRAFQLEYFAKGSLQISGIAGRHIVQAAAVYNDQRRVTAALVGVAHFGTETRAFRRLLFFQRGDQRASELRRG